VLARMVTKAARRVSPLSGGLETFQALVMLTTLRWGAGFVGDRIYRAGRSHIGLPRRRLQPSPFKAAWTHVSKSVVRG
jgi:hypothetical protein